MCCCKNIAAMSHVSWTKKNNKPKKYHPKLKFTFDNEHMTHNRGEVRRKSSSLIRVFSASYDSKRITKAGLQLPKNYRKNNTGILGTLQIQMCIICNKWNVCEQQHCLLHYPWFPTDNFFINRSFQESSKWKICTCTFSTCFLVTLQDTNKYILCNNFTSAMHKNRGIRDKDMSLLMKTA